ncbi:serine hydrolase [Sediminibacterium ginsengisoli]|nr:serine hydrolase [Sediminibacterium ginsengisoli]
MKKLSCLLLMLTGFTLALQAQQQSFIKDSLEQYIIRGMKNWQIPGLAIAIVKDGKTVFMKGYGERDMQTHAPVDENTLFMIASNSKLFTGTALAQLEYSNKLSLNDKVTRYFPDFKLYDKTTTELVTVKDMLGHHLGTKTFQGDFTFWNGNLSREEIMSKMRLLQPTGLFRQDYGYCNSCYLTAGEVIPKVSGKPWEVYVYDSILMPLGMKNTHTLVTGISQRANVSKPYTNAFTGELKELPYDIVDNLGPAGSMVSNVKDLSKWLLMQLDSGRYEGKRILPWNVIRRTRDVNTAISSRKNAIYPTHFTNYGLGVMMTDYNGRQVYWHTGGAFGFVSNTCFVPEAGLGIVILTNNDNQNFFEALRYQLLDAYLGMPYTDRSGAQLSNHNKQQASKVTAVKEWQARVKDNAPPLPLEAYSGEYSNELYGKIRISVDGAGLKIKFNGHNNLFAKLQYMDQDEWLMTYNNIAYGIFPLKFNITNGKVTGTSIRANDFVEYDAYEFRKNP